MLPYGFNSIKRKELALTHIPRVKGSTRGSLGDIKDQCRVSGSACIAVARVAWVVALARAGVRDHWTKELGLTC